MHPSLESETFLAPWMLRRDEAFDLDLGFSEAFGKEEDLGGGVKPALAMATSESTSAPKRKNGLNFIKSSICALAPAGGALAEGGAFTSGDPLGWGVDFTGKASLEADASTEVKSLDSPCKASLEADAAPEVESCTEEVESG